MNSKNHFYILYAVLYALISVYIINEEYPNVGPDYSYIIPRILDTKLFYLKNGIDIQWYTPYFGTGIPSYPNGISAQFALVQFLAFIFSPWVSISICFFIFLLIEFIFCYKLGVEVFKISTKNSLLFSILFCATGYQIQHVNVGHLFFNAYSLFPLMLYFIFSNKNIVINVIVSALTLSYLIYNAGFYMLFLFACIAPLILLILLFFEPSTNNKKYLILFFIKIIFISSLTIAISFSKLVASFSFLRYFPRKILHVYNKGLFDAILSIYLELFYFPLMAVFKSGEEIAGFLASFLNSGTYIHEIDFGISPSIFVLVLSLLFGYNSLKAKIELKSFWSTKVMSLILILSLLIIYFPLTTTYGSLYLLMKKLPVISSFSIHERFSPIYGISFIVVIIFLFNAVYPNIKHSKLHIFSIFTLLYFGYIYNENAKMFGRLQWPKGLPLNAIVTNNLVNDKYDSLYVMEISDKWDDWAIQYNFSVGVHLYEPAFGYGLEDYKPNTKLGSVYQIDNGYYNMTNPASLIFPEENNLTKWERIKTSDKENFELFIHHKKPNWRISKLQEYANKISFITFIASIMSLIVLCVVLILKNKSNILSELSILIS